VSLAEFAKTVGTEVFDRASFQATDSCDALQGKEGVSMEINWDMTLLPPSGGLTGDPSCLSIVDRFLQHESNLHRVNRVAHRESSFGEYQSLIDFLLVELMSDFRPPCVRFYEGKGKLLKDLYSTEKISEIDQALANILEVLISQYWKNWQEFKGGYKTLLKNWEPL